MIPDLKGNVESFKDFYDILDETGGWDNFISNNKIADENFKEFLGQIGNAKFDMADYQQWLVKNGKSTLDFSDLTQKAGNVLKSFGAAISSMAINWVIGEVIGLVVKGIDELAHSAEHCKERVDELMSSYESSLKTANSNAKTIEDSATKYEKLSQGVNNLGQNISLTEAEYAEYNEIVNQIAEMFPTLIQGYTEEGNAILSLKGNVDLLKDAYKEAQKEAYNMLIVSGNDSDGNDIIKNWKNVNETSIFSKLFDLGAADVDGKISIKDALAQLEALSKMSAETYSNIERVTGAGTRQEILSLSDIEKEIGYGSYISKALGIDGTVTDEEFENARREAKALIQTYRAEIDSALKNVQTLANAYLMTNDDYLKLDSDMKNAASIIVNSINGNIVDGFEDNNAVGAYVANIVDILQDNPDIQEALVGLFQLDLDDMQPQEAKSLVDIYINKIAEILEEDPIQLKTRLEFEDVDTIADNYASVVEKAAKKFSGYAPANPNLNSDMLQVEMDALNEFAEQNSINTQDEIAFWNQCLEESKTREEAMQKYKNESTSVADRVEPVTFSSLMIESDDNTFLKDIDSHIEKVNVLTTALSSLGEGDFKSSDFIELAKQFPGLADDSDNLEQAIKDLLGSMNSDIVAKFQDKFGELDTDEDIEALKAFQNAVLELGKVVGSTEFAIDISAESEGMDKLFAAMKESVSSTGLTSDSIKALKQRFQDLDSYDASRLFERTSNGIHLNTKALRELEAEYISQKKASMDNNLDDLKKQYANLSKEIDNCTDASQRAELYANRDEVLQKIEDASTLAAQYEGLTSAFYKWEQAQSIGEEGDMYDNLAGSLEDIKQLYEDGLIGTNKFRAAVQLMSNEDLSTASVDELLAAYDSGYSKMTRYFTDSSDGCLNFLNDIQNLNSEWVKLNSDGSWDINFGIGNDQEIADALEINVESVQSILRKLSDYGFDINLDSVYSRLDLLQTRAESANQTLKDMGKTDITFNFNADQVDSVMKAQINKAKEMLNSFRNEDGTVNLELEGAEEAEIILTALLRQKQELSAPGIMSVDISEMEENLGNAIKLLQDFQTNYNNLEIDTAIGADTSQAYTNLQEITAQLNNLPEETKVELGLDSEKVQNAINDIISTDLNLQTGIALDDKNVATIIKSIESVNPEIEIVPDTELVDEYIEDDHDSDAEMKWENETSKVEAFIKEKHEAQGTVKWENDTRAIKTTFEADGTVYWHDVTSPQISTTKSSKKTKANGTVHAYNNGTDISLKQDEDAVVNELGEEGLIRNGVLTKIIGGMQNLRLKAGDIILNHKQMEELEKNGYVTSNQGRGKQIGAYSGGSGKIVVNGSVKTTSSGKSSGSSSDNSNEQTLETFDWIEKAVSRVQRVIKNLGNTVSATWKSWTERNNSLVSQLNEVRKEISIQQSAYESYMRAAESVGLSDHYKNLIQNGALSIEDIADDTLKEQIKSYQEWYEKALDCSDAVQELKGQLAELAKTKFDNVSAKYDAGIQDVDFVISLINTELDKTDALNQIAGESFYNALIDKEKERIDILTSEYDELCQVFNESVATGMIAEGSEAWQGMKSGIDSVAESIREAEVQILKYENSIKEIAKLKFDDLQKQFENATNVITSNISKIEKEISLVEASGAIAGETFYQALIESGRTNLEALEQKHRSLSDSLKEALDNGSVEEYDDTWFEMTDSISSVEEAILDARLALIKYEESMKQVAKIKFDDLAKQFDNVTSAISGNQSIIEKQIAYMEATGKVAGKAFYEGLISSEKEKLNTLEQQFASLSQALQEALDSGSVVEGDDTFYEMTGQLTDLEGKIWDSRTALVEFNKELDNVAKIRFDTVGDAFSQVTGLISSDISIIEKQIALVEDSGRIAGESFYRALIESANQSAEIAEQKYNTMAAELQKGLDDGSITMYDDNWYEMSTELNNIKLEWLDAQDAVVKYQNSLKEVASIKFDSIESQFDNAISLIAHGISRIEKEIDAVEQSGMIAGESYYKELQKLQDKNIDTLKKKYDELTSILNEALDNGSVTEYSEEWYEMVTTINSVEDAIYDAESAAAKYGEQIKEIAKLKFDSLNSQFSNAINLVTSDMGLIEKQMALIEASGKEVGESFYRELIDAGNTKIDALKKQYDELYKAMEGVEKYSDNWYEMADTLYKIRGEIIDTETAVVRYGNSLKEVSMIKFDNISEQFDTALSLISYQIDEIELKMQIAQESGYIAGESFYKALISAETKNLEVLEKEYDALLSALNEALANGSIEKYDEKWVAAVQKIAAVRKAILNSQLAQAKYQSSLNNSTSGGTNTTRDIAKETFDSLEKQFSGAIGIITSAIDQLEKKMSFVEEAGYVAGESFYNALIEAEKTHIESLVKEYETLTSSLNNVEKYSDNWYDMVGSINSVKDALIDAETALVKYGNALKELEWDMFDRAQESVSRLSGESDFITELMGTNRETRNEDGTLNDRGLAVQGLHAVNYDVYMRQAQEYGEAIKKLNKEIAEDPGNTKLLDRYNELMELQRDAILNAEDEKTALKDLASEGYDSLLSRLDELTGARKDALKAASDLHDYEKTVSEQSAEVTRLQKLILNYSGNDSEEMRATIQKTQEALTKAQEELSETEYDRYIADQESMLDTFSDSMKEWVNTRLDDINGLLQNAINATNNSAQAIRDQISADLSSVGISMTDNFSKIFELDYSGGLRDIVSEYYGGGFENGLTTVNAAIDNVILETDMVKASTDMVSEILNQRFPELAASIPTLDATNDRIGNVSEAVVKTKDAMDNVHARIGELDTDTLKPKFDYVGEGIEGFDEDFNNLMKNLDGDLEQYDKNSGENLGSVEEAMEGVDAKVSETGSIANKLGDINTAVNNVKTPVEELKTPLDNVKTATEGTKETVDRIKTKLEDDSQDSIMGKIGSVTSAVGIAKTEVTSLNTLTQMNLGKVKDEITTVKNVLERIDTTVANLTLDRPGYGNSNSTPDYTVQNISEYGNSNNSTQSSGNSGNDQYQFIDKEDSYNKSQLNTSTSIVDLLKSNNYDPSLSARKKYYEDLGGSGEFIGSDAQNKWLMEKMHLMGYKNGVHNLREDEIAITQEDGTEAILSPYYGGVLTPLHKGDSVLTAEQTENLFRVSNIDADELRERIFGNTMPKHDVSKLMPERSNVNTNNSVSNNDIDVSFNIPNVRDSDEMAKFLKSDRAERIITSIMDTYALGKNKYRKLRY